MQSGPIADTICGLILAGGRSSRMGGRNKALVSLAGQPLIGHVIQRLAPQVDTLALSVEKPSTGLAAFGLPQVVDPTPGHGGPLVGLLAGLRYFQGQRGWVLLLPCDAPFLPTDLATILHTRAVESSVPAAVVHDDGALQPTFSIWHHSMLPRLEQAMELEGMAGLKQFLRTVEFAEVDWSDRMRPDRPPSFFNINDPTALDLAGRWMLTERKAHSSCSA
jgi:molybdopterin-guanine dinucleotide biosynthesis protein A